MAIYATTENEQQASNVIIGGTNTNETKILKPNSPAQVIDVRNDFIWTISPKKNSLQTIPSVYLVERALQTNSLISSALYYITTFLDSDAVSNINTSGDKILTYVIDIINSTFNNKQARSVSKAFTELKNKIAGLIPNGEDKALLNTDTLKSYVGIYLTEKTGFKYVLPYFGNNSFSNTNSWGSTEQQSTLIASNLLSQVAGSVDALASAGNILQPGSFIEKPKYFQYPTEGESITVTFPLLNTYNPYNNNNILPYQQNYELLWILAYQNKPYRTSFSRILPPKVYTLTVPGVKYMPYCYISNMTVDFQGTRRNLDVTLPTGQQIKAPIPEAYTVTLTFTSLLADIANMMSTKDFGFKINTSFR
jgi:hypothetical protein